MPRARVNGIELHYREAGEGFPVLLIHGYTGNLRNWALQIAALSNNFRTISFDHRGHGHSAKPTNPEDYSLDLMAEDAAGLLRHLRVDECYVAGHSMGGMVAQRLALTYPDLVRTLVLIDTAAEPVKGRRDARDKLLRVAREQGMEAVFDAQVRFNAMSEALVQQPGLLQVWRQEFLLTSREAYLHCARAMDEQTPVLDELPLIQAPTLVICGENDELLLEPCLRIHKSMPGSELAIIPGAGHTPQIENAPEFNRIVSGFLETAHRGLTTQR